MRFSILLENISFSLRFLIDKLSMKITKMLSLIFNSFMLKNLDKIKGGDQLTGLHRSN